MIAWVLEAALRSELFGEVMVSTEDDEISTIALEHGAEVPFLRRANTADDHTTTAEVLLEVLNDYACRSRRFTHACCLYPTAPFVTPALLKRGWSMLHEGGYDTVFPVVRYPTPIQRALRRTPNGRIEPIQPAYKNVRSQDLESAYYDAGQFYWFAVEPFMRDGELQRPNTAGLLVDEATVHDIDDEADWRAAECKHRALFQAA